MHLSVPITSALLVAALLAASPALGQSLDESALEQRDAAISDLGPLSMSLRRLDVDLRAPSGFEHVYDVPGDDGHLMRISGGLYAVFPRSQYNTTKKGLVAVIPSDTTFYIGPLSLAAMPALPAALPPGGRVMTRVEPVMGAEAAMMRTPHAEIAPSGPPLVRTRATGEVVEVTMVTDPQYRVRRTRELLRRAAEAARGE